MFEKQFYFASRVFIQSFTFLLLLDALRIASNKIDIKIISWQKVSNMRFVFVELKIDQLINSLWNSLFKVDRTLQFCACICFAIHPDTIKIAFLAPVTLNFFFSFVFLRESLGVNFQGQFWYFFLSADLCPWPKHIFMSLRFHSDLFNVH